MKKVLILTVTAGNAHNSCAKAMKEKLEEQGAQVKVVDMLKEYSTPLNVWVADKGYNLAVGKLRLLFNMFYDIYKNKEPNLRYNCAGQGVPVSCCEGLLKEIYQYKPDVIYAVHFYGAIAITDLKMVYDIPCKSIVTILDYVNSPFWEAGIGVDYFCISNEDFIQDCIEEGYTKEQLVATGLPINEKFYRVKDKAEAREELGLAKDVFTIMIMYGGGMWSGGFGLFKKVLKAVKGKKVQIIMINGKNQSDFDKIEKMPEQDGIKVLNVGFTNQVDLYMSASDIILSKMGGASSTEIINKRLPVIATKKLPSQELYNLKYLEEKGYASSFKTVKDLKEKICFFIDNPNAIENMQKASDGLRRNGIKAVAELILSQPKAVYDDKKIAETDYGQVKKQVIKALRKAHKESKKKSKEKKVVA